MTVDKVDDDKERDAESKAKKAKLSGQNEQEDGILFLKSNYI